MILTVTMNPSIDISYQLEELMSNTVNRTAEVIKTAGGKGLNVTRVLKELGADVTATGLLGGFHGAFIQHQLDNLKITSDFSLIQQETRNSIAIMHGGAQTEILESGPVVEKDEGNLFYQNYLKQIKEADFVTISGSLPRGLASGYYEKLIIAANEQQVPVLLDTSGNALQHCLEAESKPFLIKPNLEELSALVNNGQLINSLEDLKRVLAQELFTGIPWIVVSLGGEGAFVKKDERYYRVNIPKINVVNPVGSGDATIAGLAYGLTTKKKVVDIVKTAMTCGILNALESHTGSINVEKFAAIYQQVEVVPYKES